MNTIITDDRVVILGKSHPHKGAFAPVDEEIWASADYPLGTRQCKGTTTFAVYAKNATHVLLEIYASPMGEDAVCDYWMQRGPDDIWRANLAEVPAGTLYGFRCWGPNWRLSPEWRRGNSAAGFLADVDDHGNRYNPNKLLFDPYARELSHDRETRAMRALGHHGGMYGSGSGSYDGVRQAPVIRREFDTGRWAPKAIVIDDATNVGQKPCIAQKDTVIYEAHVRGLTRHPSSTRLTSILQGIPGFEDVADVPDEYRGTYKGAGYMAKYLRALGYNAIELLPVHELANDLNPDDDSPGEVRADDEPPHGNYWGYMTYGFFAPDRYYAHDKSPGGPTREFKEMVKAFHDEGIEVYLDVVYNHSAEGGLWERNGIRDPETAELLFFRGLDNAEYYALCGEGNRHYWDSTGCGNNLNCARPAVARLILDSLTYWAVEMGVDGFRFDLATVLGRDGGIDFAFSGGAELLRKIADLAARLDIEIIAEAWDTQFPEGYQVGNFPAGWAEWNGQYRDVVRRFLKGYNGVVLPFIEALNGDYGRFFDQGGPHKSVNFITAHDGFTLMDLVSYNHKNNNIPWPFGPSDGGADENDSWDTSGDRALRRQRMRNFLTVQAFSRGLPMTTAGDEFARTQNGNNNPYNIDSIGIWSNYDMIASSAPHTVPTGGKGMYADNYGEDGNLSGRNGLFLFMHRLLTLRRQHPCLRQDKYGDYDLETGDDVTYCFRKEDGLSSLEGFEKCVHWRIDGSCVGCTDFVLFINMHHRGIDFTVPMPTKGKRWKRIIDTARWAEPSANHFPLDTAEEMLAGASYWVHPYSIAVLQEMGEAGEAARLTETAPRDKPSQTAPRAKSSKTQG